MLIVVFPKEISSVLTKSSLFERKSFYYYSMMILERSLD